MFSPLFLIENYIEGREITVGILDDKSLPIIEIIPKHKLYDYECKYNHGMSKYLCPADIEENITNKIKKDSEKIFKKYLSARCKQIICFMQC